MAKKGRKNKADINKQLFNKANSYSRKKWFTDSQKSMDFYLNDQLSAKEKEELHHIIENNIAKIMGLTEKLTELGESHAEIERLNIESNAKL